MPQLERGWGSTFSKMMEMEGSENFCKKGRRGVRQIGGVGIYKLYNIEVY